MNQTQNEIDGLRELVRQLETVVDKNRIPSSAIRASIAATIAAPLLSETGAHSPEISDVEREGARKVARQVLRSSVWLTDELLGILGLNPPTGCLEKLSLRLSAIEESLQLENERIDTLGRVSSETIDQLSKLAEIDRIWSTTGDLEGSLGDAHQRLQAVEGRVSSLEDETSDSASTTTTTRLSRAIERLDSENGALSHKIDDVDSDARRSIENLERRLEDLQRTVDSLPRSY